MRMRIVVAALAFSFVLPTLSASAQDTTYRFPVINNVGGFLPVPGGAVAPEKSHTYRAVIDVTQAAGKPTDPLPGLAIAASILNTLGATGVQRKNAKLAVVVHGDAMTGALNNESYKAKYGVDNPNTALLFELQEAGAELFVCGWQLCDMRIDHDKVLPSVQVATDALIALITFQNDGYALMMDR